jgi:hypothetical protein
VPLDHGAAPDDGRGGAALVTTKRDRSRRWHGGGDAERRPARVLPLGLVLCLGYESLLYGEEGL